MEKTDSLRSGSGATGETAKPKLNNKLFVPSPATPHDPSSYMSVHRLVALEEERDPLDFLQRTLMAILLLKILQRAGYFGPWDDESKYRCGECFTFFLCDFYFLIYVTMRIKTKNY